ncbi:adenylate/guanylate cyclase domain-containing protein [Psychroserpens sp.]|uniref:adenylate/guanylate cyclase domain-containing protein n=1 Tax=Psychroserpens sp. TaxID=2020870 RepID=UPI002B27A6B8|nr:adenylate/guanylate cyclase domain-containing protein [Psychroserpens sp.]
MKETRKLNTILFADIAGYTDIMHSNEEKAMGYLQKFKLILENKVPNYEGRIVQYFGDACLLSFDSATSGVQCSIALQEDFQKQSIPIRIGMHLGEVVFTNDNVFGDGVNIASRIESMGIPGSVLLSNAIRNQIKNKDEFKLTSLGTFEFKNVAEAIEIFALQNKGLTVPEKSKIQGKFKDTVRKPNKILRYVGILLLALLSMFTLAHFTGYKVFNSTTDNIDDGMASIAVLPFADMSPQNDQEYFSDGLAEELLNVLAKVEEMKVAGRTSSFKYKGVNDDLKKIGAELGVNHILEGSVRKSGNTIRVTAQLINVEDGFHIWTETYDRTYSAENLFKIQDEISNEVLKELKVKLLGINIAVKDKELPTTNTEAYEAYLRGIQLCRNFQPKDIEKAIEYFNEAIALDPEFSLAYSRLAITYHWLGRYGSIRMREAAGAIISNAEKAILLDSTSSLANAALAVSYFYQKRDKEAESASYKAYTIDPNNPEIILLYGYSLKDNAKLKTELVHKAYKIDPLSPLTISVLSFDYSVHENYAKSQELAEKNVTINPDFVEAHSTLISILRDSPNGKLDDAFISGYAAHRQFPENLEIMLELAHVAIDLHLYDFVDALLEKMTSLYPENGAYVDVKFDNYFHQNDLDNFVKTRREFLEKLDLIQDNNRWVRFKLKNFYYAGELEDAVNFIKSYHPIYLSDTLSSIQENRYRLLRAAATLKHSGNLEQANRLAEIFCNKIYSEFEFNGDLKKEKLDVLYDYGYCACLSGDGKLASEIMEEYYFNRKSKASSYDKILNSMTTDLISETPEFKAMEVRITADINAMRDNAITFLKAEGDWPDDKID